MLVCALHTLLGDELSVADITAAELMLRDFCTLLPDLYRDRFCTADVHLLCHIGKYIQTWRPLWTHSCFGCTWVNFSRMRLRLRQTLRVGVRGEVLKFQILPRKWPILLALCPMLQFAYFSRNSAGILGTCLVLEGLRISEEGCAVGSIKNSHSASVSPCQRFPWTAQIR